MALEKHSNPQSLRELLGILDSTGVTGYRRYAAVKQFLSFKAREKGIPFSGSFELTPLCNLDCRMCYVHLDSGQLAGHTLLDTRTWKELMRQAVEAGMMNATLTGGECLTYPGFRELYLYLQSMGIEVLVCSNGLLMDEEMIGFFRKHPPAGIQITLYGASEDAYEKVTGRRCFRTVFQHVLRLKEEGIPLKIAVTPNEFMEDGEQLIALLHEHGLQFAVNPGLMKPREETGRAMPSDPLDVYVQMVKAQRRLTGEEILPSCDPDELPGPSQTGQMCRGVRCGAGRSAFSIGWDGVMRPCNTFPVIREYPLKDGFLKAWKKVNEQANCFPIPAECGACRYECVSKPCVAEHADGAPIGHASPAVCEWCRRMVMEGIISLS